MTIATRAALVVMTLGLGAGCAPSPDAGCSANQSLCGGMCTNLSADDNNCGSCSNSCSGGQHCAAGSCIKSRIEHVVLIVEENHTFDAYFGLYCRAAPNSNPTCTAGPTCCEAAPATEPRGAKPFLLTDATNFSDDRDHDQDCELLQINGGQMDNYVTGTTGGASCQGVATSACSSPNNWMMADQTTVGPYWSLADNGALADRYFQPVAGGTSSNNMFFAGAQFLFTDNSRVPQGVGSPSNCALAALCLNGTPTTFTGGQTIADLLLAGGKTFGVYADGYGDARASTTACESVPSDCPYDAILHPVAHQACRFDSSDIPFLYYEQFVNSPAIKDYGELQSDLSAGTLPNFAYVKAREFHNEHPNVSTITDGVKFVTSTISMIQNSSLASSTLILVTWDEGGGFFDHVPPPASIETDAQGKEVPYGTRVPLIAIGPFAKKGAVSHVQMEHSSIVRFLEFNFVGPVGQLRTRDSVVNNIGSLLDASKTGIFIPEQ